MGDMIYRPLIDRMKWSYSRLETFEDCPYRFFMHYIDGAEEDRMFFSDYGLFMHKLIESYYKDNKNGNELSMEFITKFSNKVFGERPGTPGLVAKYIRLGSDYLKNIKPFPFEPIGVEVKVDFKISGENFVGIIDYLGYKDGEYYIVDNKSRELKPRSKRAKPTLKDQELDSMLKQLYIYSAAVKELVGKYPKALCFNCFKNQQFITEEFNSKAFDDANKWALDTIEKIKEEEEFSPKPEFFKCKYICGLHDECCYYG